jgi:hypothetical protein
MTVFSAKKAALHLQSQIERDNKFLELILEFKSIKPETMIAIKPGEVGNRPMLWIAKYWGFDGDAIFARDNYRVNGLEALAIEPLLVKYRSTPKEFQRTVKGFSVGLRKAYFDKLALFPHTNDKVFYGKNLEKQLQRYGFTIEDCKKAASYYYKQ